MKGWINNTLFDGLNVIKYPRYFIKNEGKWGNALYITIRSPNSKVLIRLNNGNIKEFSFSISEEYCDDMCSEKFSPSLPLWKEITEEELSLIL